MAESNTKKQAVIAVVGSLNVDLVTRTPRVPVAGETLLAHGFDTGHGGKGANQAVACARLSRTAAQAVGSSSVDVEVRMIGAVGDDAFGGEFLDALRRDGLDVGRVRVVPGEKTGVAVIIVEEATGQNRIMASLGANNKVEAKPLLEADTTLAVFQLEIPMETVLVNARDAKERGIDVLINPAPAVPLPDELYNGLGHLIVNESEAALLTGKPVEEITPDSDLTAVAADFVRKGVKNVIITLGGAGCFYQTAARQADKQPGKLIPARKVKVVDTTAAGDTFVGAYAVAVARSKAQSATGDFDVDSAIAFANRAAALTVQRNGAQAAIPWVDEVPGA
ncbi:putative ribokinase [Diplodia seriata]|uniref:Ribokinase n=1 Tax=Diplodia seriata TaxID=420778 RepID=A0A0G2GM64_9PEZI|nr:putative ribokinase [Diplodia seriata]